jgi:hypothetical protein
MTRETALPNCLLCDAPSANEPRMLFYNQTYGAYVCDVHRMSADDGFARHFEPRLKESLRSNGLVEPTRLKNGLLPPGSFMPVESAAQ